MPPSPVMKVSPGMELKLENHKRGRSLESGILYRKEDDLALFNEVRSKERDDFLLQSNYSTSKVDREERKRNEHYNNGVRFPTAEQIQRISAKLRQYGKIEGQERFLLVSKSQGRRAGER